MCTPVSPFSTSGVLRFVPVLIPELPHDDVQWASWRTRQAELRCVLWAIAVWLVVVLAVVFWASPWCLRSDHTRLHRFTQPKLGQLVLEHHRQLHQPLALRRAPPPSA